MKKESLQLHKYVDPYWKQDFDINRKGKEIKQILSSFVGHGYKCLLYRAWSLCDMQQYMTGTLSPL